MKRFLLILLSLVCIAFCVACGKKAPKINDVVNKDEAVQYKEIFFENNTAYDNKKMTKTGIFTILYDAFNDTERYYVWGYENKDRESGWQWEFSVKDPSELPKAGSEVTVSGKFVANEKALDKKWIENASVKVESEYKDSPCKYDLTTMSPVLSARVQMPNIINHPSKFEDESICVYGKLTEGSVLSSPYEDMAWSIPVTSDEELPEAGSFVTVIGKYDEHGHFVVEKVYTK